MNAKKAIKIVELALAGSKFAGRKLRVGKAQGNLYKNHRWAFAQTDEEDSFFLSLDQNFRLTLGLDDGGVLPKVERNENFSPTFRITKGSTVVFVEPTEEEKLWAEEGGKAPMTPLWITFFDLEKFPKILFDGGFLKVTEKVIDLADPNSVFTPKTVWVGSKGCFLREFGDSDDFTSRQGSFDGIDHWSRHFFFFESAGVGEEKETLWATTQDPRKRRVQEKTKKVEKKVPKRFKGATSEAKAEGLGPVVATAPVKKKFVARPVRTALEIAMERSRQAEAQKVVAGGKDPKIIEFYLSKEEIPGGRKARLARARPKLSDVSGEEDSLADLEKRAFSK